ncbi:MAG: FAD/NAD(P)-binding oxidoreductase [Parvularculaceae bacterium]|nr:NAD(P)/FAD-dependent oxidoreductase [Parvularculaceae bacterium]
MKCQIAIIGGGSAGIAVAASLLKRRRDLDIAIIEPKEQHYYQPGWTMVGGGVFDFDFTVRPESSCIPRRAKWIKSAAKEFVPESNTVVIDDGTRVEYDYLIAAPGLKLNFAAIPGLEETLGENGVTSNYKPGLARYTWDLVKNFNGGKAIFTQAPLPFKCPGAPQKAMYLAAHNWKKRGVLENSTVSFCTAAPGMFGVAAFVPALLQYVESYGIDANFGSTLVAIDGAAKKATFKEKGEGDVEREVVREFDMIHVCPPQVAADVVRGSPLADAGGWIDVDQQTLRHKKYANVFGLGDAINAPNSKTAAAARKQAPVVAENLLAVMNGADPEFVYDGYASCPLTVARGKTVFAEFGYGGKLLPTFPAWLNENTKATLFGWLMKAEILPWVYWELMLDGHEWFAKPKRREQTAAQ